MARAAGRTTRMLEEAQRLSKQGRAVYVIMASKFASDNAKKQCTDPLIKFETPSSLGNFDWETMTLRGAHRNCVVLVDHFAIENRFAAMLEMLHRFDTTTQDQTK